MKGAVLRSFCGKAEIGWWSAEAASIAGTRDPELVPDASIELNNLDTDEKRRNGA